MTEVYINNVLVDLEDEETITASYGGVAWGTLGKRKGIKSNTYVLPFTQVNKAIYEGAEVQGSFSDKPYRRGVIRAEIEGVTVFEGWCVLDEAKDGYEVQSFAGASDFYTIINNKKLSELDLSQWSHIWNDTNIKQSWSRTEGFIYAFTEYGKEFPFNVIPPDYLLPQLFFHSVIKQIATDAGYTLYGEVLDNPRFLKKLVIANNFPIAISYGGTWDLSTLLDKTLTQSKMWLDFANCFGLQFDINELTHVIYANYIDDVLFNDPEDWSDKVDRSEKPRTRYRYTEYGKATKLSYKTDDIVIQDFAKVVAIDDDNLKPEADLYKSEFYLIQDASVISDPDGRAIARTFITKPGKGFSGIWRDDLNYIANENAFVWWNGSHYSPLANSFNQEPPNATYWKPVEEKDIWDIKSRPMYGILTTDVTSTLQVAFTVPEVVTRVTNNFGMSWEEIYTQHYRLFNRIVQRTKRVEQLVKLIYADANQLDFSRAKRIDGELYFMEEVKQFKLNRKESTLVDLVRI